jgi:hypothetical protein
MFGASEYNTNADAPRLPSVGTTGAAPRDHGREEESSE